MLNRPHQYVFDKNTDKVVYGGNMLSSQSVRVDVDNNRIMLDSQIVSENSLHAGDEYRIYFEPTGVANLHRGDPHDADQYHAVIAPNFRF